MGTPLRTLIVEDSEHDTQLLRRELHRGGYEPVIRRVETSEAMQAALDEQAWDVVLADYVLPQFSGPAALELVKARGLDIPFIMVSGKMGEDAAVGAMRAGAHDYIMKDNLARLNPAIEREVREAVVRKDRRQLEEQLLRAQRLEMAGRIAAQVAHDFGNLLTPIIGYSQMIKKRLHDGHPASELCDALLRSARQMAALNDDMLTLGRRGRLNEEQTDLNLLVKQALAQLPDRPDTLRIEVCLAPQLLTVSAVPDQLMRAISNLLFNARDAMKDDGVLTIKTENFSVDRPFGHYNRVEPGEYVRLSVTDTGCGIPPNVRDHIFDPFFTTKPSGGRSGSGLGLSIVQAIVEDHRGCVDLASEVGNGTTFYLYIPARQSGQERSPGGALAGGQGIR